MGGGGEGNIRTCICCGKDIDLHEETQLRHCLRKLSFESIHSLQGEFP